MSDQVREFYARVLAWPSADLGGYVNLHWRAEDTTKAGEFYWHGRPCRGINEFLDNVQWAKRQPHIQDLYHCTSLQAQIGASKRGYAKPIRNAANAIALKSIWLDLDVKDGAYTKVEDAVTDAVRLCKEHGLPKPTALVASGGGVHVYWISDRPLAPGVWQPYASGLVAAANESGLKCDFGCTIDSARILRVPGTNNYKSIPLRPVRILHLSDTDIDFAAALTVLPNMAPHPPPEKTPLFDPAKFPKRPIPPEGLESLAVGIDRRGDEPLKWEPVLKECGFIRTAVKEGGASYDQPLWNLTTLAATFLKDGEWLAHKMSKGHKDYKFDQTQKLWDRKVRERKEKGLGWPSCKTINDNGCKSCAGCLHFAKGKSPLHLSLDVSRPDQKITASQTNEIQSNPAAVLMRMRNQGAKLEQLLLTMNEAFAVTKYGGEIVVAQISGNDVTFMKDDDFHKMLANLTASEIIETTNRGKDQIEVRAVKVSKRWFEWLGRRQYLGRGVVFKPGGPLDIPNDMLNLWRGFGVEPKHGDWSLMRNHIRDVICSGNEDHYQYLISWMGYALQHPDMPIGVAVALLGAQGAGKGIVARTFGMFFGKHFTHIAHGEQLTGRFNASLGTSCAIFLDEALWAGDRKGEGVLKALITEPTFQLEAKFRDPIMIENRLRIIVASNNDWAVPAGIGDRRWFVLNVANTYAGTGHRGYWVALHAEVNNGGAAAMLYDLLAMDLRGFDVRAVPHTAAKAQQQAHSLRDTIAWLYHILHEGEVGFESWQNDGLTVSTASAYKCYEDFSKQQRAWRPDFKAVWSRKLREVLGTYMGDTRMTIGDKRVRSFKFAPLVDCRRQFARHIGTPDYIWEESNGAPVAIIGTAVGQVAEGVGTAAESDARHDVPSMDREPGPNPDADLSARLIQKGMEQAAADRKRQAAHLGIIE